MRQKMNNSLVFSELRPEDAKELSLLDKECFSTPWSEQMFYEDATNPNAHYVLARINDNIVGYCGIYKVLEQYLGRTNERSKRKQKKC